MILATKTKLAIDTALEVDGGAKFRSLLREAINACGDAFDPEEQTFRSHLGCSLLGKQCARELWYSFSLGFQERSLWTNPKALQSWPHGRGAFRSPSKND